MVVLPTLERAARVALRARGFRSRMIETSLAPLHVYDAQGRGPLPPIVVLHGFGSTAAAFAPLLVRLRSHCRRVLAPEAPGHGFSGQPLRPLTPEAWQGALLELLDRELDEPAFLFGNSLGGAVAIRIALDRPTAVRGLVLASPAGAPGEPGDFEAVVQAFKMTSAADARRFMGRLYHRAPWYTSLIASDVMESFSRPVLRDFLDTAKPDDLFAAQELRSLTVPILLIWGQSDRIFPSAHLSFFRSHLPAHATIEEPARLGHCPHIDDPGGLARRIVAFARGIMASAAA
jgi:pimeloyl-ACP methyl ester carboxylesterase